MTTNSGQEHAGEGVRRFGMIDEASGHEPLWFGETTNVAPYAVHGPEYVLYTDHRAALENALMHRNEARAAADHWKEYAQTRIAALEAENARLREMKAAAEQVTWFDWSGNDDDAVAAVDRLRAILGEHP